ncbi:UNVERIFIED_CONTAM: hypothetical protein HDU68_012888 [Siphonaria sp. JEL0065]|nr:hypothetical protein HDU68_012888 [Siphonaria sp. JEL0065]
MKLAILILGIISASGVAAASSSESASGSPNRIQVPVGGQDYDHELDLDAVFVDDFDDGLNLNLQEQLEAAHDAAYEATFLEKGARLLKNTLEWVGEHKTEVLAVFAILIAANAAFVAFVMGYLLKEEHFIVRAIRFDKTTRDKVFRVLADFDAYPLWRKNIKSVSVVKKDNVIVLNGTKYSITEEKLNALLVLRTHPNYEPEQYAQPLVMKGAPVPENINELEKKKHQEKVDKLKEQGIDATAHVPKHRPKNVLDLDAAPVFLPPGIPWATEMWTIELEPTRNSKGTLLYVTYRGTLRSRIYRFLISLVGFDRTVERFLGDLASFLGESNPSVKPYMGKLPELDA